MAEFYISNAKYTCRGCLKISEDCSTMTAEEISTYKNYVKAENTNTIMKICFICRYMLRKCAKFILQCRKSNEIMKTVLEEDHIFQLSKHKVYHNYISTLPVVQYLGPETEYVVPIYDCDEIKHYDDTYKHDDEVEQLCDDIYKHDDEVEQHCDEVDGYCDDIDKRDDDDVPLVMLKECKEERDMKVKKKREKRLSKSNNRVTEDSPNERKSRSKVQKQLKEGFSSRMVQETNEYEVIKLTKEQVLKEMEEKCNSEKYQRSVYKCEKCAKGFNFKDVIDNHMKKHSQEHGILKCEICTQYCPSAISLRGHMKSHTTRYKCKICGAIRISRQHLLEHYTIEHTFDASVYTCEQCSFTTKNRTVIQRHVRSHKVGKSLTCSVCGVGFTNMHTLRMHTSLKFFLSRHDPSQRFSCPQCNMKFIYPSLLHRHMRIHSHRDHYCVECDVTFKSNDNLKLHFKRAKKHRDPSTYKHKCQSCSERFPSTSALLAHQSAAHGAARSHACARCGKLYCSRDSARAHERRAHRAAQCLRCDVCHKDFSRKYVLAKHLRTHTDASQGSQGCCGVYAQSPKHKKEEESNNETSQTGAAKYRMISIPELKSDVGQPVPEFRN